MELIGNNKVGVLPDAPHSLDLIEEIVKNKDKEQDDGAFMLINLNTVLDRYELWKKELPMIEPFYAVKCNTDPVLVRTLAALDVGFDCASAEEIDIVMNMGVQPERVIYANPCKTRSFISHAKDQNVKMMTFDNAEELKKIMTIHPNSEMILRIAVSDPTATCPLNLKFGCEPVKAAPKLLTIARDMGVNVVGISFHVGSGCNDPTAYRVALEHCKRLHEMGIELGFNMHIIDMGGGFPGDEHRPSFEEIASIIRQSLEDLFPNNESIRWIAEPGRFFAALPFSLVANVIHSTEVPASKITKNSGDEDKPGFMYFLNDGVYGSFNCILFDHVHPVGRPLFDTSAEVFPTTIWGPTCDSLDMIEDKKSMRHMEVGEWVLYEAMGAYTCAASTTFNGFARPTNIYVIGNDAWQIINTSPHI